MHSPISGRSVGDDEVQGLLEELIAIDSVNPDLIAGAAGEDEIASKVGGWLEDCGVAVRYQEVVPGRRNVVGRVAGRGGGRSLMLNAHLDTVGTATMPEGLHPIVRSGQMYGRGAHDMKSGLAAAMVATARAVRAGLAGDVIFAGVVDEEGESKGTETILSEYRADGGIVLEPTGHVIVTGHNGFAWADIETDGVAAHGSDSEHGVDAILAMGHVMVEIDALGRDLLARPAIAPGCQPSRLSDQRGERAPELSRPLPSQRRAADRIRRDPGAGLRRT